MLRTGSCQPRGRSTERPVEPTEVKLILLEYFCNRRGYLSIENQDGGKIKIKCLPSVEGSDSCVEERKVIRLGPAS